MNGDELYALVERYHGFGIHRAGTEVDHATTDWYAAELERRALTVTRDPVAFDRYAWRSTAAELERRALTVTRDPVAFDRYAWRSTLTADGRPVDHLPLFYEWTGRIDTVDVGVVTADAHSGGRDGDLDDALDRTRQALVIATEHAAGSLVAVNREPRARTGSPTVLIAGRDAPTVDGASEVRLTMEASLEPATTTNLVARTPGRDGPYLLLTTPLTGWFGCAGERGTGAAVLLDLVERFADRPLLVVATGGHELDYLGVRSWVPRSSEPIRAIAHVGASVAVDEPGPDGDRTLIRGRLAMTDLNGEAADRVGDALEPASFVFRPGTDRWLGESEVFCDLRVPMLSFTGSGVDFHTPDDTPLRSTSAGSLAVTAAAIGAAVDELWRAAA